MKGGDGMGEGGREVKRMPYSINSLENHGENFPFVNNI